MRAIYLIILLLGLLVLQGCCTTKRETVGSHWCEQEQAAINFNEHSLVNYRLAKQYMAQGRYELARYRLQQAHNSAQSPNEKWMIQRELDNANRLVKAQR